MHARRSGGNTSLVKQAQEKSRSVSKPLEFALRSGWRFGMCCQLVRFIFPIPQNYHGYRRIWTERLRIRITFSPTGSLLRARLAQGTTLSDRKCWPLGVTSVPQESNPKALVWHPKMSHLLECASGDRNSCSIYAEKKKERKYKSLGCWW